MSQFDSLDDIARRLDQISLAHSLWPQRKDGFRSVLVSDLYSEWGVHFLACYGTLKSAHGEFYSWLERASDNSFLPKEKVVALTIQLMENAVSALEVDDSEKFFKLMLSLIESAAQMLGVAIIINTFEATGIFEKIKALLNIGHADFMVTDDLLFGIEASMQAMLTAALFVEAQVGSLTGRFTNTGSSQAHLIAIWKAPIVMRIHAERREWREAGVNARFLSFPVDGYWQSGLEGASANATEKVGL